MATGCPSRRHDGGVGRRDGVGRRGGCAGEDTSQRNDFATRSRNCQLELRSCLHGLHTGVYEKDIKIPA
jgi:hypothetical protein